MNRFCFEPVGREQALNFWQDSPYGSVFSHPEVLSRLSPEVEWWLARKGKEPYCMWPVVLQEEGTVRLPEITYYVGPMWSKAGAELPVHSRLADHISAYQGLASILIKKHGRIHAQLPLGLWDVRAFAWWNHDLPQGPKFRIIPRYTAQIRHLQKLSAEDIQDGFRPVRRKEIRRLLRKGPPDRIYDWDQAELSRFFCLELSRQGLPVSRAVQEQIKTVTDLAVQGWGEVIAFRDPVSWSLASALVMLRAQGSCNLVLHATVKKWRIQGLSAWSIYNAILAARELGDQVCDFNGANSPDRGDDKHSYGAEAGLFFELKYP
ncbi:MAG: hypothetical protein ACOCPO_04905 [Desulfohalobiaceae bacterium]